MSVSLSSVFKCKPGRASCAVVRWEQSSSSRNRSFPLNIKPPGWAPRDLSVLFKCYTLHFQTLNTLVCCWPLLSEMTLKRLFLQMQVLHWDQSVSPEVWSCMISLHEVSWWSTLLSHMSSGTHSHYFKSEGVMLNVQNRNHVMVRI